MQKFKYETHTHTSEVSACSHISALKLVRYYHSLGYSGICISDHFFNGNVTIPGHLSWDEKIRLFCQGYYNAKAEGDKLGIKVFFGWEFSFEGTHYLTYNLTEEWLYQHPEIMDMHINDYLDLSRSEGAFVIHAHPFRESDWIPMIRLLPRRVDGVEVDNANMSDDVNRFAEQYADNYGLLKSAGSDTHDVNKSKLSGICFDYEINNITDMVEGIKNGHAEIFRDVYGT